MGLGEGRDRLSLWFFEPGRHENFVAWIVALLILSGLMGAVFSVLKLAGY